MEHIKNLSNIKALGQLTKLERFSDALGYMKVLYSEESEILLKINTLGTIVNRSLGVGIGHWSTFNTGIINYSGENNDWHSRNLNSLI